MDPLARFLASMGIQGPEAEQIMVQFGGPEGSGNMPTEAEPSGSAFDPALVSRMVSPGGAGEAVRNSGNREGPVGNNAVAAEGGEDPEAPSFNGMEERIRAIRSSREPRLADQDPEGLTKHRMNMARFAHDREQYQASGKRAVSKPNHPSTLPVRPLY